MFTTSLNSARELAEHALIKPVLGKKAFDEQWHEAKEVREVLVTYVEGQLIQEIQKREVWDKMKNIEVSKREEKGEEVMQAWKGRLRKSYPVEINENLLESL